MTTKTSAKKGANGLRVRKTADRLRVKKAAALIIACAVLAAALPIPAFAATANPTASTVLVNGSDTAFDAYNIDDFNYFKLRDVAFTISGTEKQFEVSWDEAANAISLVSGKPYTAAGGEMTGKGSGAKSASPTTSKILVDGKETPFTAYNIDGNNYFKLRDIGAAFNFGVDWDGGRNTIVIDTGKGYAAGDGATAPAQQPDQQGDVPPAGGGAPDDAAYGPELKLSYSASEIAKLLAGAEALIQEEPTNGKEISQEELYKLLDQYRKDGGSGNTYYEKTMKGSFEKKNGKWAANPNCEIEDSWSKDSRNGRKTETLYLKSEYSKEKEGAVECRLNREDDSFYYTYEWFKAATTGIMWKSPKRPGTDDSDYDADYSGMTGGVEMKYMRYPDAKVDGQDCIVYSYTINMQNVESKNYNWFSKSKGFDILYESVMPSMSQSFELPEGMEEYMDENELAELFASVNAGPRVFAIYTYDSKNEQI